MPLFEYACLECGIDFESLVLKSTDIEELKCPVCKGKNLEQKISSFASVSNNGASNSANCVPSGG